MLQTKCLFIIQTVRVHIGTVKLILEGNLYLLLIALTFSQALPQKPNKIQPKLFVTKTVSSEVLSVKKD